VRRDLSCVFHGLLRSGYERAQTDENMGKNAAPKSRSP